MLENIRAVLINTYHPGNIGSAARALKTMGITRLYLVQPERFPAPEATQMAANACDLLDQAVIVDSLEEAIADCSLVIGTSARSRSLPWPMLDIREGAARAVREADGGAEVALVFGREKMGLHNDELQQCNFHLAIPANPEYPVLNVAAAVQVLSYELWQAAEAHRTSEFPPASEAPYPRSREMELFYKHLEETLHDSHFIIKQHPGQIMQRLRRLFNRCRPEKTELSILRGILSSVQREIGKARNNS